MQNTTKNKKADLTNLIEQILYIPCGYCTNNQKSIFKSEKSKKVKFYAGTFLIKHRNHGYILYDTGYDIRLTKKASLLSRIKYFISTALNPVTLNKNEMIDFQLKKLGINLNEIKYVILSHLHSDHIGRSKAFKNALFILTKDCYKNLQKSSFKALIFKEFLPKDLDKRLKILDCNTTKDSFKFLPVTDLFNDNSMLISSISGHAKGQACVYFPERKLLIAADVSWRDEYISKVDKFKIIPKLIQDDFNEYKKNINLIKRIKKSGIKVIFSHEKQPIIKQILKEQ